MKKFLHLSFLFLATFSSISFAISCPPTSMVEEKIKNSNSTIDHKGLQYHISHSDFNSKSYQLSKTQFAGIELAVPHKAPGGNIISCHYKTFNGTSGEIVLESNNTFPKNTKPNGWILEEGVYSCQGKEGKDTDICPFSLTDAPKQKLTSRRT